MKRILAAAALASAAVAAAGLAHAGELYATGWKPTGCAEPVPPARDVTDATSLNFSIARYNDYVGQVNAFNDCVRAEAERDMAAIRSAAERAQITALRDAETTRLGSGQAAVPPPVSSQGYAPPPPAYTQPAPAYTQPAPTYAPPAPVYTRPAPTYAPAPQTLPPPAIGPVLPVR